MAICVVLFSRWLRRDRHKLATHDVARHMRLKHAELAILFSTVYTWAAIVGILMIGIFVRTDKFVL